MGLRYLLLNLTVSMPANKLEMSGYSMQMALFVAHTSIAQIKVIGNDNNCMGRKDRRI